MTQQTGQNSTTQVAKGQAADVGRTTADAGRRVAGTASEQAGHVAQEAKRQARDLVGEARGQAKEQANNGQQKVAQSIRGLAGELREMAQGGEQHGTASELAAQAADRLSGVADWVGNREPADLLEEVRSLARRRPGAFLIGAAVAGVLAGRLTRGAVDAQRDSGPQYDGAQQYGGAPQHRVPNGRYDGPGPLASPPPPSHLPETGTPLGGPALTGPGTYPAGAVPPPPVPPVAPAGPAHSPRPGATTVGEYVEEFERGTPPQHGGGTR